MDEIKIFNVEDDESGDTVEAVPKTEYDKIQEDITAKDKEIEELNKKLAGEDDKDKNFNKLRKAKEAAEKDKGTLAEKLEEVSTKLDTFQKESVASIHDRILTELCGDDEEAKKKLKAEYDEYDGELFKDQDIKNRYIKASRNAFPGDEQAVFLAGIGTSGSGSRQKPDKTKENFTNTERGKDLAKSLGIPLEEKGK